MSDINTIRGKLIASATRSACIRCVSFPSYRVSPAEIPVVGNQPVKRAAERVLCPLTVRVSMFLQQDFTNVAFLNFSHGKLSCPTPHPHGSIYTFHKETF